MIHLIGRCYGDPSPALSFLGDQGTQKKEPDLQQVNHAVLAHVKPEQIEVEIWRAEALGRPIALVELAWEELTRHCKATALMALCPACPSPLCANTGCVLCSRICASGR